MQASYERLIGQQIRHQCLDPDSFPNCLAMLSTKSTLLLVFLVCACVLGVSATYGYGYYGYGLGGYSGKYYSYPYYKSYYYYPRYYKTGYYYYPRYHYGYYSYPYYNKGKG